MNINATCGDDNCDFNETCYDCENDCACGFSELFGEKICAYSTMYESYICQSKPIVYSEETKKIFVILVPLIFLFLLIMLLIGFYSKYLFK